MMSINWNKVKLVILDVDGTLYNQKLMHRFMALEAVLACCCNPGQFKNLKLMMKFRAIREEWAGESFDNLQKEQYQRLADKEGISTDHVQKVIEEWLLIRPLKYLSLCRFEGLLKFVDLLKKKNKQIACLSDYPAKEKLNHLLIKEIKAICATDPQVNVLKPHPKGLEVVVQEFGVRIEECLYIGDRDDRDGEAARRIRMPYLLIDVHHKGPNYFNHYGELIHELKDL